MPVGRRPASRPAFLHDHQKSMPSNTPGYENESTYPSSLICHNRIPIISGDSNLFFELIIFAYSLVALALQFINLYHTVFWLPHSHTLDALNFHMIDRQLAVFVVTVSGRRLIWCVLVGVHVKFARGSTIGAIYYPIMLIASSLLASVLWTFVVSVYRILWEYPMLYWLFLAYPVLIYGLLFGPSLLPAFVPSLLWPKPVADPRLRNQTLYHACSNEPERIRLEVEILRLDFNFRVKQVLFNSTLAAYYSCVVPVCFAQSSLHIDTWWVAQFTVLAWFGTFLHYCSHYLGPNYIDVFHKSALHLGRWHRVERASHLPLMTWSELQIWPPGALVKHVKGHYRSEGASVAAEPGNSFHSRFYTFFAPERRFLNVLTALNWLFFAYMVIVLLFSTQWYRMIVISFLISMNYYILFKITRDWLVVSKSQGGMFTMVSD